MSTRIKWMAVALVVMTLTAVASFGVSAQQNQMSFFVTSAGSGNGANLGGLAGADKICQTLAAAAGAGGRTWRAYLSAAAAAGQPAVNAKDRIGKGPWMNAKGVVIAKSVEDLHSDANNIKKDTALTEKGTVVNGVGDTPNQHDIITGSQSDGTLAVNPAGDSTCSNYTAATDGAGIGAARTRRSHGPRRDGLVVEQRASVARLLAGESRRHGRQRIPVLLRGELGRRRSASTTRLRNNSRGGNEDPPYA